jgi:hypothetical protein
LFPHLPVELRRVRHERPRHGAAAIGLAAGHDDATLQPADLRADVRVRGSGPGGPGRETARRPQARAQPLTHLRAVARGNGRRGDGRSRGRRRRRRRRAERPRLGAAAEDAGELRRELLHGGGGGLGRGLGADGLGVGDANVGEDLPRQPAAVEVVRLGREAVRHEGGREGEGAHWQAGRRATDERAREKKRVENWRWKSGGWFL